ncbi:unnamed protein product, partial [Phaeothamnion confervicola]
AAVELAETALAVAPASAEAAAPVQEAKETSPPADASPLCQKKQQMLVQPRPSGSCRTAQSRGWLPCPAPWRLPRKLPARLCRRFVATTPVGRRHRGRRQ